VPSITGPLTQQFKQFDYEIQGDRLFVYSSKTRPTLGGLQDMAHVGTWLATHLEQTTS
jgi:hypothetical protein